MLVSGDKKRMVSGQVGDVFGGNSERVPSGLLPTFLRTNLLAWYDASVVSSITDAGAGAVSQWNDLSGSAYHLTQGTGGARPTTGTRTINGRNVIDFDGSSDFMDSSCPTSDRTSSTFVVAAADTFGQQDKIYGSSGSGGEALRISSDAIHAPRCLCVDKDNVAQLYQSTLGPGCGGVLRPFVAACLLTDTTIEIRINGASQSTSESSTFTAARTLRISGGSTGVEFFNGVIGEFIKYSAALAASEADMVIAYLSKKWGIPAPGVYGV